MLFTVTDEFTGKTATVDAIEIAEAITPWFAHAPAEVTEAIEGLEMAVRSGDYSGDLEAYLGVTVTPA